MEKTGNCALCGAHYDNWGAQSPARTTFGRSARVRYVQRHDGDPRASGDENTPYNEQGEAMIKLKVKDLRPHPSTRLRGQSNG